MSLIQLSARDHSPKSMTSTRAGRPTLLAVVLTCLVPYCLMTATGCRGTQATATGLPKRHTARAEEFVVHSDVKLPRKHPLLLDLVRLQEDVASQLQLPVARREVALYVFADELRYAQFLNQAYPDLPPRRAYFIGTSDELAVYTFWGDRIQEDLRHEATHGVLHASLKTVPLWLDEGLAEYFETPDKHRGFQPEYATRLAEQLRSGWQPRMERLEQLDEVGQMQRDDYQEAWAWVHFLLHHSEDTRGVLIDYLKELRTNPEPGLLSEQLAAVLPTMNDRFVSHATTMALAVEPDARPVSYDGERDQHALKSVARE